MKKIILLLILPFISLAQSTLITPGNGQPNILANSTNNGTLVPRLNYSQIRAISNAQEGTQVYDTEYHCLRIFNGFRWMPIFQQQQSGQPNGVLSANIMGGSVGVYDNFGNYYTAGTFLGSITFGNTTLNNSSGSYGDVFIVKYSQSNQVLWAVQISGSGPESITDLVVDNNGGLYFAGSFRFSANFGFITKTTNGNDTVYFAKYDATSGLPVWVQTSTHTTGSSVDRSYASSLILDTSNNVYLCGNFAGDISFGSIALQNSAINSMVFYDGYLLKCDNNGVFQWVKQIRGDRGVNNFSVDDNMSCMAISGGFLYLGGEFCGTLYYDGVSTGVTSVGSNTGTTLVDGFVAKINTSTGTYQFATSFGGNSEERVKSILVNGSAVVVTGSFVGSATFGSNTITAQGSKDAYLLYLIQNATSFSVNQVSQLRGVSVGANVNVTKMLAGPNSEYYVIGSFNSGVMIGSNTYNTISPNSFLIKLTYPLNIDWSLVIATSITPASAFVEATDINYLSNGDLKIPCSTDLGLFTIGTNNLSIINRYYKIIASYAN